MGSSKKILVIAYHFPPDRAVGALRPQKFVKYLPEFGWQPFVVTIKEKYAEKLDNSRLGDLGGVHIDRTEYFRSPLQAFFDLRDKFLRKQTQAGSSAEHRNELYVKKTRSRISRNIIEFIHWLNCLPDNRMYWILPAVLRGYRTIKTHGIRYIYATSPPHSGDIVGALLAKITGAHLILDLRDPWSSGYKRYDFSPALVVDGMLERFVLNSACKIITTTEEYAALLAGCYNNALSKFTIIYNGFDSEDLAGLARRRNDEKFVCTYLGNFYLQRSPVAFLAAVRELLDEKPELAGKFHVRFVGTQRFINGISLEELRDEQGLRLNVSFENAVSYRESLQNMIDSDVLLLFAPSQPMQIPAKLFEYMAVRCPILALTEEGATATLVERFNAGLVVPQDDPRRIKEGLLELYNRRASGYRFYGEADLSVFDRKRQTLQLAELLEGIER